MKHRLIAGLALALAMSSTAAQSVDELDLDRLAWPRERLVWSESSGELEQAWQAEQARRELVDARALAPDAAAAAELCATAEAIIRRVVPATRTWSWRRDMDGYVTSIANLNHEQRDHREGAEYALKLSRLARNLREEAEHLGHPC